MNATSNPSASDALDALIAEQTADLKRYNEITREWFRLTESIKARRPKMLALLLDNAIPKSRGRE